MKNKLFAVAVTSGLIFALGACSDDNPEEHAAAACTAYDNYVAAVKTTQETMSGSATVGEIKEARGNLQSSYNAFSEALGKVAQDRVGDVDAAWKNLDDAVNGLDENQTASEASASLVEEFQGVQTAQEDVYASLGCS